MLLKGQIFSFGCEAYNGAYGIALSKNIYEVIKEVKFSGQFQIYLGNLPYWSSDYAIGLVPKEGKDWDFWKAFEEKMIDRIDTTIKYYGIEATNCPRLEAAKLLFAGSFQFKDGLVIAITETEKIEINEFISLVQEDDAIDKQVK